MVLRSLEAIREGKKPMEAQVFAAVHGANKRQYEFRDNYFDTLEQLKDFLEGYEVIDGRPNVFFIFPSNTEVPSYEGD